VGVPAEPVIMTEAVTEPPKVIGLTGTRVGTGTVGVAALTVWILTNTQIESRIRNSTIRICSFFMFLHSDISFWLGFWLIIYQKTSFLLALTFPNLMLSDVLIHKEMNLIRL